MSAPGSSEGVLTPDLLVKGVNGLRVIDASVMVSSPPHRYKRCFLTLLHAQPVIPSAHTEAPIYYIAERGADLIKAAWNL